MSEARSVVRAIDGWCQALSSSGIAADYTTAVSQYLDGGRVERVTWSNVDRSIFRFSGFSLREYLFCIEKRQYTFLLFNGGFAQVSYDFRQNAPVGHRLLYWPSPFVELDLRDYPQDGIWDVVGAYAEHALELSTERIALRGPIRFDHDPHAANERHPATHLTTFHDGCRIASLDPLHLRRFARCLASSLIDVPKEVLPEKLSAWTDAMTDWADPVPNFGERCSFGSIKRTDASSHFYT